MEVDARWKPLDFVLSCEDASFATNNADWSSELPPRGLGLKEGGLKGWSAGRGFDEREAAEMKVLAVPEPDMKNFSSATRSWLAEDTGGDDDHPD